MGERQHIIEQRRQGPAYADDYGAWIDHQLTLLRERRAGDLDYDNLIEEVGDLGRSEFRAFVSAIEIVIVHMLKWDLQPERRSDSWRDSIAEHRARIEWELGDSPSYRARVDEALSRAFNTARLKAARQMRRSSRTIAKDNPYDWTDITTREHLLPGDET